MDRDELNHQRLLMFIQVSCKIYSFINTITLKRFEDKLLDSYS